MGKYCREHRLIFIFTVVMSKAHTSMLVNYYGKETIDTNTYGKSTGHSGSYSTNYQIAGRELLTPDEVRMLDNEYALLFIRGEKPIIDKKYLIQCKKW